ncbi:MAG TPA: YqzL family protein [Clostridiaceae bacterium]|nr:YqzL family protein [Clostridiaceae bacterium]
MLKDFLWNAFLRTGNIEAYLALKEILQKSTNQQETIAKDEVAVSN